MVRAEDVEEAKKKGGMEARFRERK